MIKVKLLKIDVIVIGVNSHQPLPQILAKNWRNTKSLTEMDL